VRRTQSAVKTVIGVSSLFILFLGGVTGRAAETPDHVPGRLVVGHRRDADRGATDRMLRAHQAMVRRYVAELRMSVLDVPEEQSEAILESLRNSGLFEYVERDYYARTGAVTPNDPYYISQWHLPQISAPAAWGVTTGSASVIVAVIDSGVDGTHPDLSSKLLPGWNFVGNNSNTSDVLGHGTAVAGTVAAASNNGIGVAGVSWNSMILPLVVVDSSDYASYSNMAAAIQYAADHGAQVMNVSLGGSAASSALQNAVNYAWGKGSIIFAAAMNNSSSMPMYPAACSNVVAVSATDTNDTLASFSDYGNWITLSAPGNNILTTLAGGGYGMWYGTSFASPIAAGVAALALAANPALNNSALLNLLEQNSDDLGTPGYDTSFGWGRVNAYKAVTAAQNMLAPASISISPMAATLSVGQMQQFTPSITGGSSGLAVTWSMSPSVGTLVNGLYTAPGAIGSTQVVTITATLSTGATSTAAVTLNPPPATISISPGTVTLSAGQTQQFTPTISNGAGLTVSWSLNATVGTVSNGLYAAPGSISSTQTITVTATLSTGVKATGTITLVPPAAPPMSTTSSNVPVVRVNAGGGSYIDPSGNTWGWDNDYIGGYTAGTGTTVAGTTASPIYQTCRWGGFTYQFPVSNGSYTVILKFAEIYFTTAGSRVFNVSINGTPVLTNFDIVAQAGGALKAIDKAFPVTVTNGQISIQFSAGAADQPLVNAIEIDAGSSSPAPPPTTTTGTPVFRAHAGGGGYTDPSGNFWNGDYDFVGGYTAQTGAPVSGTTASPLYETCRWGSFSYPVSVANGNYTVTLKFAEIYFTTPGSRIFNVSINGTPVLTNFDIVAQAGGALKAIDESFPVTVTNGVINIQFTAAAADQPLVNAIQIVGN
jgi:hypothetical protein